MGAMDLEYQIARLMALTPQFLVMVIGVIVALKRLPKHPRPCWLILAALALDGIANLGLPIVMQSVMQLLSLNNNLNSPQNRIVWSFFWTLPYSLLNAVTWALVLFAVFDRPDPPKFLKEDDLDRDILDRG